MIISRITLSPPNPWLVNRSLVRFFCQLDFPVEFTPQLFNLYLFLKEYVPYTSH